MTYITEFKTSQGLELWASNDKGQEAKRHFIGYTKKEAYKLIRQELKSQTL